MGLPLRGAMPDTSPRPRIVPIAHGTTDVGRTREHNEDQFLVAPDLCLFVVCDGMGGNNAGEVASALATTSLRNYFQATESGPAPGKIRKEDESLSDSERRLVLGVRKANSDVFEISSTRIEHQGMGSTIVAMHVSRDTSTIEIAHIGDSRCYRIREGKIQQLTRDHSLIGDALAWNPNLSEEELSRLPRNIISRALGLKRYVEVDVKSEEALPGDVYLLCSDGLSGMVKDPQILELFLLSDDLTEACENLIAMANEAGGSDNITAVAVRIEADPDVEQPALDPPTSSPEPTLPDDPPSPRNQPLRTRPTPSLGVKPRPSPIAPSPDKPVLARAPRSSPGAPSPGNGPVPEIAASPLAVDELLSYLDGAPEHESASIESDAVRCAQCGGVPAAGDVFCGHCGARIVP
jgi:serine/threonine protein phosphatase PrpC